jgi:neutral trehalase
MNALLWDEEDGTYYDRLESGKFTKVLTPSSFFPLMAGVPSKEQAAKMVKTLTNPGLLWTKLPLSTISQTHPMYGTDMWRGGVWLNLNYFIIKGLYKYGYDKIAEELKTKTLETVNKWYKKTGAIFEFFDSRDEVYPYECERKGKPTTPPDWRKQVHSIVDFNWSSCFTLMFIQDELYLD